MNSSHALMGGASLLFLHDTLALPSGFRRVLREFSVPPSSTELESFQRRVTEAHISHLVSCSNLTDGSEERRRELGVFPPYLDRR